MGGPSRGSVCDELKDRREAAAAGDDAGESGAGKVRGQ